MRTRNINKLVDCVIGAPCIVTKRLDIWANSAQEVQPSGNLAEILGNIEECFSSFEKIKKYLNTAQQNALTNHILKTGGIELPADNNNNANG